jgi:NCS1 family nucleobase:cation symporter-1
MLVLAAGASADVLGIGASIAEVAGGPLLLVALLVGESDNAFADIYSAAVSSQNVVPRVSQRGLSVVLGVLAFALALFLSVERYEVFLFLIGSVFVPLFGVFAADYLGRARRRYGEQELFAGTGVRWLALVPWALGFLLYQWSVAPGTMPAGWTDAMRTLFNGWLRLPFPLFDGQLGASVPSFAAAFVLTLVLVRGRVRENGG